MNIREYADSCAENIVRCIEDVNVLDMDTLRPRIRAQVVIGLSSVLRNEESELAQRQRKLIEEQADWRTTKERKARITAEIASISQQRKSIRQAYSRYGNDQRYGKLRAMLRERGHQDLLDEFDAQNGTEEPFAKLK